MLGFILGGAQIALGLLGSRSQYQQDQTNADYRNAVTMANYQASVANRALSVQHQAAQRAAQRAASAAEVVRLNRQLTGLEFSRVLRQDQRAAETGATRLASREQQATAMASAGAAGVAGTSIERLSRAYANIASRRVAVMESEARKDVAGTQLQKGDAIQGAQQNLIRINQPLAPIPEIASPVLSSGASSSSQWLDIGTAVLGGINTAAKWGAFSPNPTVTQQVTQPVTQTVTYNV